MKKSQLKNFLALLALILLISCAEVCPVSAQAQDFPHFKTARTGKGIMLMNKTGAPDYAVLIGGAETAEHIDIDGGLRLKAANGEEIIAYHADAKLFAKAKTDEPETLMENYRAAQIARIEIETKEKITLEEDLKAKLPVYDLRGGKNEKSVVYGVFWSFSLSGARPARRTYLSVLIGDSILTLRRDLSAGENAQENSGAFVAALETLTILPPQNPLPSPPPKKPIKKTVKKVKR